MAPVTTITSDEPREHPIEAPAQPRRRHVGLFRVTAALAVALAAGFAVWFFVYKDDDKSASSTNGSNAANVEVIPAHAASVSEIEALAKSVDYPVYWAGPLPNRTYELTRTQAGRIYVRYLPKGVAVGDPSPNYLTVGTYPQANGYAALEAASKEPNTISRQATGGAFIVYDQTHPRSVYFSFKNAKFQVEVFDPTAGKARDLTYNGEILRVG